MSFFQQTASSSWTDNNLFVTLRNLLESALFRNPEPQPVSTWRMIIDPPMPYWITLFSQSCRLISLLILLPIFLIGIIDFAGYAVFRTLGLHRRRVRIQRQTKSDVNKPPLGRSSSRRKPRVYQNDRHRPTDRSNIPSIVKAPLLTPGTYDAETLLRQRARSLSIASAEEEAAWVASGGQQARLSSLAKRGSSDDATVASPATESGEEDYFGRAPRVGVDGALGMADTDAESGTESGRDSPVKTRRRGLSGGLNFTPVSPGKISTAEKDEHLASAAGPDRDAILTGGGADSYSASVVSLSSDSPTSSSISAKREGSKQESRSDAESSNMSSSWIGVEADAQQDVAIHPPITIDAEQAAAAAGLESSSNVWKENSS
ncbi:hypothetical protein PHBOTO_003980 [Pseudozyma hubeiensis]|nr:hypothetical protein PHBOTO_003980 [Pseudozyma hubeiensis]